MCDTAVTRLTTELDVVTKLMGNPSLLATLTGVDAQQAVMAIIVSNAQAGLGSSITVNNDTWTVDITDPQNTKLTFNGGSPPRDLAARATALKDKFLFEYTTTDSNGNKIYTFIQIQKYAQTYKKHTVYI